MTDITAFIISAYLLIQQIRKLGWLRSWVQKGDSGPGGVGGFVRAAPSRPGAARAAPGILGCQNLVSPKVTSRSRVTRTKNVRSLPKVVLFLDHC